MTAPDPVAAAESPQALAELNRWLGRLSAVERVEWGFATLAGGHALSSSFGAQASVSLHLVTRVQPDVPVILIDTGYLFAETYRFADELRERLSLNLQVFHPQVSAAWMEAHMGRLWEHGIEGLNRYNQLRKVEPMQRALRKLDVRTWIAGLRRTQSHSRAGVEFIELRDGRWKFHPIADWTDRDVGQYLARHDLPCHPLWEQGFVSIGDTHSTRRWEPGMREEDTRFFGLKRECGLHEGWETLSA
jgi:phosphoadenosine phosphosulfate reductase